MTEKNKRFLTTGQVAQRIERSEDTVRRWATAGFFPGALRPAGKYGQWMIPEEAVAALLGESGTAE